MKVEVEHCHYTERTSWTRVFDSYGLYGCTCVLLVLFNSKSDKSANSQDLVQISTGVAVLTLGHSIGPGPPLKLKIGALNSYEHADHESVPLHLICGKFSGGLQTLVVGYTPFDQK